MTLAAAAFVLGGLLAPQSPYIDTQTACEIDQEGRLDHRICTVDEAQVDAVCDLRDWRNPRLVIESGGGVRLWSLSKRWQAFPLSDVRVALRELPVSDWPYGRIVAVPPYASMHVVEPLFISFRGVMATLEDLRARSWAWNGTCGATQNALKPRAAVRL